MAHTLTAASPPYGAPSNAPLNAPSASPPRSNCLTCCPSVAISFWLTGANAGWRVEVSKLEEDSGSRASMLIVRQLSLRVALETCWIIDMAAVVFYEREGAFAGRGMRLNGGVGNLAVGWSREVVCAIRSWCRFILAAGIALSLRYLSSGVFSKLVVVVSWPSFPLVIFKLTRNARKAAAASARPPRLVTQWSLRLYSSGISFSNSPPLNPYPPAASTPPPTPKNKENPQVAAMPIRQAG